MTLPMHLEKEFAFIVTEVTATIIQMPIPEMSYQISVIIVALEAATVRLFGIAKTLKTAQ
jgi:hypothetical protein